MELTEVESIFDTSQGIYCLKLKGKSVGLSGEEIEEAARRCNSHEKLVELRRLGMGFVEISEEVLKDVMVNVELGYKFREKKEIFEQALKESEKLK